MEHWSGKITTKERLFKKKEKGKKEKRKRGKGYYYSTLRTLIQNPTGAKGVRSLFSQVERPAPHP